MFSGDVLSVHLGGLGGTIRCSKGLFPGEVLLDSAVSMENRLSCLSKVCFLPKAQRHSWSTGDLTQS